MKKKVLLLAASVCFLCGCEKKEPEQDRFVYSSGAYMTFDENGVFYTDNNILKYADNATGKDIVLCNKANCNHDSDECNAYYSYDTYPYVEDGRMILLTGYGREAYGEMSVWQADVMGTNRHKLADIGIMQGIQNVIIDKDQIIINYVNSFDENFEYNATKHAAIYRYDIQKGEGEEVWACDAVDAFIGNIDISGDSIVAAITYNELTADEINEVDVDNDEYKRHQVSQLICINGNEKTIISDEIDGFGVNVCKDEVLYKTEAGLNKANIHTGETEVISDKGYSPIKTVLEDKTLLTMYDTTSNLYKYTFYDHKTGKLDDNEIACNYDARICNDSHVYGENYDSPLGSGYLSYIDLDSFVSGKADNWKIYLDVDGNEKYKTEKQEDFDYKSGKDVVVEGDVDDIYEAWQIVLEDLENEETVSTDDIRSADAYISVEEGETVYSFDIITDKLKYDYGVKQKRATPYEERGSVSHKGVEEYRGN